MISIIFQRTLGLLKTLNYFYLLCMSILSQSMGNVLCTLTVVYQVSCKYTGGLCSFCLQQLPCHWGWKTQVRGIAGWHHKTARGWTVPTMMAAQRMGRSLCGWHHHRDLLPCQDLNIWRRVGKMYPGKWNSIGKAGIAEWWVDHFD